MADMQTMEPMKAMQAITTMKPKKTRKGSIFAKGRKAKETVFRGGKKKTIRGPASA